VSRPARSRVRSFGIRAEQLVHATEHVDADCRPDRQQDGPPATRPRRREITATEVDRRPLARRRKRDQSSVLLAEQPTASAAAGRTADFRAAPCCSSTASEVQEGRRAWETMGRAAARGDHRLGHEARQHVQGESRQRCSLLGVRVGGKRGSARRARRSDGRATLPRRGQSTITESRPHRRRRHHRGLGGRQRACARATERHRRDGRCRRTQLPLGACCSAEARCPTDVARPNSVTTKHEICSISAVKLSDPGYTVAQGRNPRSRARRRALAHSQTPRAARLKEFILARGHGARRGALRATVRAHGGAGRRGNRFLPESWDAGPNSETDQKTRARGCSFNAACPNCCRAGAACSNPAPIANGPGGGDRDVYWHSGRGLSARNMDTGRQRTRGFESGTAHSARDPSGSVDEATLISLPLEADVPVPDRISLVFCMDLKTVADDVIVRRQQKFGARPGDQLHTDVRPELRALPGTIPDRGRHRLRRGSFSKVGNDRGIGRAG